MQDLALPWLVLELTGSAFLVGLIVFCRYAPFSIFGLWGGVAADRYDNRRVMLVTQTVGTIVATTLAVLVFTHTARLWAVFALALMYGFVLVFDNPARNALTYRLVGPDELSNAIALNSSLQSAARVLGPALGGVLIAAFGVGWCFAINAISFAAVMAALLAMRVSEFFPLERPLERTSSVQALREILRYFRNSPEFVTVTAISMSIGLCGFSIVRTQLPLLTTDTLHDSSRVFGLLFACYGAGALVGALLAAAAPRARWRDVYLGALGLSIALFAIGPIHVAAIDGGLLVEVGLCWILFTANAQALLQLASPDRLRGRVVALYVYGIMAPAPLGSLVAGWLTEIGGTTLSFAAGGAFGIAAVILTATLVPQTRAQILARRRRVPSSLPPGDSAPAD